MTKRNLAILLLAAVVVVLVAALSARPSGQPVVTEAPLLPDLATRLDEVARIELATADGTAVTLIRGDNGWGVAERDGYPADASQIRALLLDLSAARTVEAKTARPDQHHHLGLQALEQTDAPGTQLTLLDAADKRLASILVGRSEGGLGDYARLSDSDQSWLVSGLPRLEREPQSWLARQLLDIGSELIHRVEVMAADGKSYALVKDNPGNHEFRLENADERELDPVGVYRLSNALSDLRLEDVRIAAQTGKAQGSTRVTTFDGRRVQFDWWQEEEGPMAAAVRIEHDPEIAERFAEAELAERWTPEQTADLDQRLRERLFILPEQRSEHLRQALDDLLASTD